MLSGFVKFVCKGKSWPAFTNFSDGVVYRDQTGGNASGFSGGARSVFLVGEFLPFTNLSSIKILS